MKAVFCWDCSERELKCKFILKKSRSCTECSEGNRLCSHNVFWSQNQGSCKMVALSQYLARYFHTQALRRAEQGKKVPRQGPKIPWDWKSAITKELLRKRRILVSSKDSKDASGGAKKKTVWEFVPTRVPDGISLRNFGIQVVRETNLSCHPPF